MPCLSVTPSVQVAAPGTSLSWGESAQASGKHPELLPFSVCVCGGVSLLPLDYDHYLFSSHRAYPREMVRTEQKATGAAVPPLLENHET